jgi:hypothetical protein
MTEELKPIDRQLQAQNLTDRVTLLGFVDDKFVVLDRDRRMVVLYSSAQLASPALYAELGLPRGWSWRRNDYLTDAEDMIDKCIGLGPFDPARIGLTELKRINHLDAETVEALGRGER